MISLNNVPVEIAVKYGADTAIVYAILYNNASDGICKISWKEITNISGISASSIARAIKNLESLNIVKRYQNKGKKNEYHIKNVFEDAASEQPPAKSSRQEPEQQKSEQPLPKVPVAPKYKFPYYVMLSNIGSSLAADMPLSESDVDNLTDDRETELCTIPSNWAFSDDQKTVEDALKYLAYYSQIKAGQKKDFVESTIIALSEAICTGMKNNVHGCNPETIISRLNTIIHSPDINLGQWLDDFARVFSDKFDSESKRVYNYYAYLKTAAINYLTEYKSQVYNGFYEDE